MAIVDIIMIVLVFAAVAYIGYISSKKVKSTDDYFVASHSLGKLEAGLSMAATDFGGASLLGACGVCYAMGVGGAWWSWAVVPSWIIVGLFLVHKLQPLYLATAPEFLGNQYDKKTRTLASIMHVCGITASLSGQFLIAATTLNVLLGIPQTLAYWLTLLIILGYTVAGGLIAVVKTDVLQFFIIMITILALVPAALNAAGGWGGITSAGLPDSYFDWGTYGVKETLSWVVWGIFAYPTNQAYLQRVFASKDKSTARFSFMFTGGIFIFSGIMLMFVGMAAAVLMPGIENSDSVFVSMVLEYLPVGLKGLAVGGIFAAVMSTADSQIMAVSTIFVNDIYKPFFWKGTDDKQLLKISRVVTVLICIIAVLVGLNLQSIIDIVYIAGLFYSASVFYPLVLALYWKKAKNGNAAFFSILAAVAMGAFSRFYLTVHFTSGILSTPANIMGSTVGLIVFIAITLLSKDNKENTLQN